MQERQQVADLVRRQFLESRPGPSWETWIVRSRDLKTWESSPLNPVMAASPEDKTIRAPALGPELRARIAAAVDRNNSDFDLCEIDGKVLVNYSWGNQEGNEFLAEAEFDGTLAEFLRGWFPEGGAAGAASGGAASATSSTRP